MVQSQNSFLIRKQTFIVKNNRPIDEVYLREKKVSQNFIALSASLIIF